MNSSYRWLVLGSYAFVAGLSQLLWLNFAPIITLIETKYNVTETQASLLILVFPLIYVLLSLPSGVFIDKFGYRRGVGLGVIIMSIFACLRIDDRSFTNLLIAQIGISISQPFIINGISKLVLDWFSKEQGAIATGLGTVGMFIGMAIGMAVTPLLVDSLALRGAMIVFAMATLLASAIFFIVVRDNPEGTQKETVSLSVPFTDLFKEKNLLLLFLLSFLGLGFFNGLTTWLELILAPQGISSAQAGIAGGVLILGGILGAAAIPALSDHYKKRKPFLIGSIAVAAGTIYPLCQRHDYKWVLIFSGIQGFFFLPAFSLLLEMCSELVGKVHGAAATGILMLTGNAGGVLVVLAMEWVKGSSQDFSSGVHLLFILLMISLGLSFMVLETRS